MRCGHNRCSPTSCGDGTPAEATVPAHSTCPKPSRQILKRKLIVVSLAMAPYAKPISILVVVVAVSYVSLIIGELVPKQIALKKPEAIAARVAPAVMLLTWSASPIVWLLSLSVRSSGIIDDMILALYRARM
jgi:hypothetical protein